MSSKDKRPSTKLVEGGRRKEWRGRLVNPPVERASTILFDSVADMKASRPGLGVYRYGLQGTRDAMGARRGADRARARRRGDRALFVGPGRDHDRAPRRAVARRRAAGSRQRLRSDAQVLRHDPQALRGCDALLRSAVGRIAELTASKTRAILLESPGSLTMEVQDVPGDLRDGARTRDRHAASTIPGRRPCCSRRSPPGSTSRILAATKYVGGHADVMLGAVTATKDYYSAHRSRPAGTSATASRPTTPGSARAGLRTMAVRLKQHEDSALKVAQWLKEQPQVGRCFTLPCPIVPATSIGSATSRARRACSHSSSRSRRCRARRLRRPARAVRDRLQLGRLRKPRDPGRSLPHRLTPPAPNLVRLHIGLEDADDLIEDLAASLVEAVMMVVAEEGLEPPTRGL